MVFLFVLSFISLNDSVVDVTFGPTYDPWDNVDHFDRQKFFSSLMKIYSGATGASTFFPAASTSTIIL